ncbi:hypothetical protein NDU88_003576 [Pleurodeles waltl]|uniref:Uncharacterized protein n=1 Tax=Pleurodeles waltl TaxID=8319 RepID=A0AAV7SGB9_PLEWA|nr:hypothetical protein NDU88_003576 [Pleurodeles waltl]
MALPPRRFLEVISTSGLGVRVSNVACPPVLQRRLLPPFPAQVNLAQVSMSARKCPGLSTVFSPRRRTAAVSRYRDCTHAGLAGPRCVHSSESDPGTSTVSLPALWGMDRGQRGPSQAFRVRQSLVVSRGPSGLLANGLWPSSGIRRCSRCPGSAARPAAARAPTPESSTGPSLHVASPTVGRLSSHRCIISTPPVYSALPLRPNAGPEGSASSAHPGPGQQLHPIGAPRRGRHLLARPLHQGGSGPMLPRVQGEQFASPGVTGSKSRAPPLPPLCPAGQVSRDQADPVTRVPGLRSGPRQGRPAVPAKIAAGA